MASLGGAASGAATGAGLGSIIPGIGTGIGAIAGGLIGLFKGGKDTSSTKKTDPLSVDALSQTSLANATSLSNTGKDLTQQGTDALHPVLAHLLRIYGGDRTAGLEEIAPEVNTITDQYDAAYKHASSSTPRGGGRNATLANLPYAKDAAIQTALQRGRSDAGKQIGEIGTNLSQLGIGAQSASASTLSQLIAGAREGHAQSIKALEDLGLGLGQIAAMIYAGKKK